MTVEKRMKSTNGFSDITNVLAVGKASTHGGPTMRELKQEYKIGTVIDLNNTKKEAKDAMRAGLEYVGVKMPLVPTVSMLESISEIIDKQVGEGRRVFVHCHQGIYRAPTAAVAYLVFKGRRTDDAVKQVKNRRSLALPDIENSQKLLPAIRRFEEEVRLNKSGTRKS